MKSKSTIIWEATIYMWIREPLYGAGLGAAYGAVLATLISTPHDVELTTVVFTLLGGALYGAGLGAFLGFILGMMSGLLIGAVTAAFFMSPSNHQIYHRTLQVMGGLTGFSGTLIGLVMQPTLYFVIIISVQRLPPDGGLAFFYIPAFIAALCTAYVSNNYAKKYLKQQEQSQLEQVSNIEVLNYE